MIGNVMCGNGLISGLFDGLLDCPLPNNAGTIMKYFLGLSAMSSPISHSLSEIRPLYHVGYIMAGFSGWPNVL